MNAAARIVKNLLYPRRCPFCDRVLGFAPGCPACETALAALRLSPPRLPESEHLFRDLSGAAAVWRYSGRARQAILRFKNGGRACYGEELGARMARELFLKRFPTRQAKSLHGKENVLC